MSDRPRIAVIGAGVIGASIGYHLSMDGCDVLLVGPAATPQPPMASWASAGGLKFQRIEAETARLTLLSSRRWPRLAEELDSDIGLRLWGSLDLATSAEDLPRLQAQLESDRARGMQVDHLSGGDFAEVGAQVSPLVAAGNFVPSGGQADPWATTTAFLEASSRRGARILATEVRGLMVEAGSVTGLITADGREGADLVVVAAGHWSAGLVREAGVELPLRPAGAHMLLSGPVPQTLYPTLSAVGRLLSIKQLPSTEVMIGGGWPATVDDDGKTCRTRPESVAGNLQCAAAVAPWTGGLELEHAWCGIDGETPDHLPLIGPVAELPGLYLATGFSLGGFQLAPAVGRLVGDEILGGAAQGGLSGLRPSRFGSFEPGWLSTFQRTQRDTPKW
jgi:sarcosine oxidase subunit beta